MTVEATGQAATGNETAASNAGTATQTPAQTGQTAAATTAAPATTIAGDTTVAATEVKQVAPADWPENWRDKLAESLKPGDAAFRKRLDRFTALTDVGKSWLAMEAKQSSGEFKRALPKDAKPEEVTAWRTENGIPDSEKGYLDKLALPNGVVLGEADKPLAESFAKAALAKNWSPEQYNDAVSWYFENLDATKAKQDEADTAFKLESEDTLRKDWPAQDFRRNLNAVNGLLAKAPQGLSERLLSGRLADGRRIGDDPSVVKWLASLAIEINPYSTLIPTGTGDVGRSAQTEIDSIQQTMRDDPQKYWKDEALQARYRDLLSAQEKVGSRAA